MVQKCIVVLGMHRSGTSALMGVLHLLGVDLGSNFLNPSEDNPKGFFENFDIAQINEKILTSVNSSWDSLFPLPDHWWNREEIKKHKEEIVGIIQRELKGSALPGFKDPRISRLLPLWKNIFEEVSMKPLFVILLRNPIEVARSLKKRNGFSSEKSLLLWMDYILDAELYTRGFPRVFVSFDELFENPEKVANNILASLGVNFPKNYQDVKSDVEQFLTPELRHYVLPADELKKSLPMIHDLYRTLREVAGRKEIAKDILSNIDAIRTEYFGLNNFFCHGIAGKLTSDRGIGGEEKGVMGRGKASIIIVTYNNLNLTKACIESILSKTDYPHYEIVVVDNGSTDGTPTYLKELDERLEAVSVILNPENNGYVRANNQGIEVSMGDYIILLNNDTIVTKGWLTKFVNYLNTYPEIGLIGPLTNACFNEAKIPVTYEDVRDLDSFADRYTSDHEGKIFDIEMLAFYCVAMRREIIGEVGLLDERFGIGLFEDDDYSHRVKLKGYRVVCAEDIFIHHVGMASFGKLQEDGEFFRLFERNRKLFEEKWDIVWDEPELRHDHFKINYLKAELRAKKRIIESLTTNFTESSRIVDALHKEVESRKQEIEEKGMVINQVRYELDLLRQELFMIQSSHSWRAVQKLLRLIDGTPLIRESLRYAKLKLDSHANPNTSKGSKSVPERQAEAPIVPCEWGTYRDYQMKLRRQFSGNSVYHEDVQRIVRETEHRAIIFYPSPILWDTSLVQRPHQLFKELSKRGYLIFFLTIDPDTDKVIGVRKVDERLYIISDLGSLSFFKEENIILWISWTPNIVCQEMFPKATVVYDWIDELDVFYLYSELMETDHQTLLSSADIVFVSSSALIEKAKMFSKNVSLVPNGVFLEDFAVDEGPIPRDMENILSEGKPLIGFYGSLERWRMNYDLVNFLCRECADLNFVLIGPSFDDSLKRLVRADNLFLLGAKSYEELKYYLRCFDVAFIPYVVNRITNAVFPVKLCEYMAGGKPIVTTAIRECQAFRSVLIANGPLEFAEKIRHALTLKNDGDYLRVLALEASGNTWGKRADTIVALLDAQRENERTGRVDDKDIIAAEERGKTRGGPLEEALQEIERLKFQLSQTSVQRDSLSRQLSMIQSSYSWRAAKKICETIDGIPGVRHASVWVRGRGAKVPVPLNREVASETSEANEVSRGACELMGIVGSRSGQCKDIMIFPPAVDWNLPLFQRPHHLALQLAKRSYLSFYCTSNHTYDQINGFQQYAENLFLTDRFKDLMSDLSSGWVMVSSISSVTFDDMKAFREKGFRIIYDYLDDIHPDISGALTKFHLERHKAIGPETVDLVLAISKKLRKEMTERFPAERVILFPNGVDYEHFHRERSLKDCPEDMKSIVTSGNPIIGYHGALAKWIDYDLLNALAEEMPDWNIVLIGWDYDGSLRALRTRSNITYLGLKTYNELPSYSVWFDVALIPFKTGDIAQSTSPIKLYEYMALNKPTVVTRDLIECHGYKSVFIARDKDDFIEKVEAALRSKDDPEFIGNADGEARANTWQNRAAPLDATICKYS